MVGIKVGGTYSGLGVGVAVGVRVLLGRGVSVDVTVAVGDGIGAGVEALVCPHAMNTKPMMRKTTIRKRFFILTHSLGTMLDVLLPTIFYRQDRFVDE